MMERGLLTPVKAPPQIQFNNIFQPDKKSKKNLYKRVYSASFIMQFFILLKRTFLIVTRDPALMYYRLGTHFAIAMFIGILYYDVGDDASNALNNSNYIFFSNIFLMYTSFSSVITTCKYELTVFSNIINHQIKDTLEFFCIERQSTRSFL